MTNHLQNQIHLDSFDENVLLTAQSIVSHGHKSVYELKTTKQRLGEDDECDYVFLSIHNNHASLVLCDWELFEQVFKKRPQFGEKFVPNERRQDVFEPLAMEVPLTQYHVNFDPMSRKYLLTTNLYYFEWFNRATNYFCGSTRLPLLHFQLLCLMTVSDKYQLVQGDCLSFAVKVIDEVISNEDPEHLQAFRMIASGITVSNTRLEKWIRDWLPRKIVDLLF